jgi:glutamate formiminotransferase
LQSIREQSSQRLVECVPNFSEGRRPEVIDAILKAIKSSPIYLLDWSADHDHNRMVVTFAGEPEHVLKAMYYATEVASALINLDEHEGVHPRIGAVDVIPFIPLRGVSMDECITLSRRLGQQIAEQLAIPVYLYEASATRPERVNLANIRRGGYETLKTEIATNPDRVPDFGQSTLTSAGAAAIGARRPLIAFNVYLDTEDVRIAQTIAETIRESNGGLPHVKALGLPVGGRAQVSINVVDFQKTALYVIMQAVRAQAAQLGVDVAYSELVGLIPQAALIDYAIASLELPPDTRDQVLEKRLGAVTQDYRELTFE